MFSSGYTEGSDTLAHLFRIQEVSRWLHDPGTLFDWTDAWYGGFHQFALYPFLTYLPAGVLDALTGSPLASMKAVILASVLTGAAGMYFASLELTRELPDRAGRSIAAADSAVTFALSPAFLGFMFGFGEYSDFVAIAFGPAFFLVFLSVARADTGTGWTVYGVGLALIALMHPHVAVFAVLGHGAYLLFSPWASGRRVLGMAWGGVIALLLTLFFWLPFLELRDTAGDSSLGTPFTNPVWAVEFGDYFDRELALRYIGTVAVGLAIAGAILRQHRRESLPLGAMGLTGAVLALGGTIPISTNVPVLDLVNPERALVMVLPAVGLLAGFAVAAIYRAARGVLLGWQSGLLAAGVIALVVVDGYFFNERTARTVEFSRELLGVTEYLASQQGSRFDRVLFLQEDYNLTAYTPALSGKPVTDGSQVQGSQAAPDAARLAQPGEGNAGLSRLVALASRFHVRWIVVDRELAIPAATASALMEAGLAGERFAMGRYAVLETTWAPSLVRAAGLSVLEIGDGNSAGLIAELSRWYDFQPERGASARLDDYSVEALAPYDVVVLANPRIDSIDDVEAILAEYQHAGGFIDRLGTVPAASDRAVVAGERERVIATDLAGGTQEAIVSMGYGPLWDVQVDGAEVEAHSNRGFFAFSAAQGQHEIKLTYETPLMQRFGQFVSILSWVVILGWLSREWFRSARHRQLFPAGAPATSEASRESAPTEADDISRA
jgi:hypothetical protein